MNRLFRRMVVVVMSLFLLTCFSTIAYGLGAQWHVTNNTGHGCYNYGCTGSTNLAGDYYYQAKTQPGYYEGKVWVSVHNYINNQKDYGLCYNCTVAYADWDTNPEYECRYNSVHLTETYNGTVWLPGHKHYTESRGQGCPEG